MIDLKDLTLVCIDDIDQSRSSQAIFKCIKYFNFGDVKLFTSNKDFIQSYMIEKVIIKPIKSKNAYSRFILKDLINYINTKYVLIIQWDGSIINPNAWDNEFLNFDYSGAVWPDGVVGNGGVSIRSKKLLKLTSQMNFNFDLPDCYSNEDVLICRTHRKELEQKGIKFMPVKLAKLFSVEDEDYNGSFCWHGNTRPRRYSEWLIKNK